MLSVPSASFWILSFLFFPTFWHFAQFFCESSHFLFSLSFLTFTSHLIASSPFCGLSPLALSLSVSVFASPFTSWAYSFSSAKPFHLTLSVPALSCDPYLSFGSIVFISCSFSTLCLRMLSLSLCISLSSSALFGNQQTRLLTKVSESIFKMSLAKWQKVIWKVRDSQHSLDSDC